MSDTVKAIILPDTTEGGILQAEWENGEWVITVDVNTNGARVVELTRNDRPFVADGGDIILDPRPGPSGRPTGPVLKSGATGNWRLWGFVEPWDGEDQ